MGIINEILFSFVNVNNLCYFHNKTVTTRNYILFKYDCKNNTYVEIQNGIILANSILDLKDITKDGKYLLNLPLTESTKHNIYFSKYNCLRNKIISLIHKAVCVDCKCNNCNNEDCINKKYIQCIKNQELFTLLNSYLSLLKEDTYNKQPNNINTSVYNLISLSFNSNVCETELLTYTQLLDSCINHNTDINNNLFKKFIGLYYLALYKYNYDIINVNYGIIEGFNKETEILELNNIYNYNIIKTCLLKVNVALSTLIQEVNEQVSQLSNTKVYYYKTDLGINDDSTINKPFITYDIAKQGYLYELNTLGHINLIIESLQPFNFSIEDLLGNDITDDFSVTPISALKHHYKSINLITPSSVYLKIKQI